MPREFVRDLRTGLISDVKNFGINLSYPGRAFANIYALNWKEERNKTAHMPVK